MTTQLAIRIDEETKERFARVSRQEGKSASEKMRELIEAYVRKADLSTVVDDIWGRIGEHMRRDGITEHDVVRAVRNVRARK
jgi:predicted DNA-binding protein